MNQPQNAKLEELDKAILNQIQSFFPITPRPYATVGKLLGLSEAEVVARVRKMVEEGVIRRIGANFNSRQLGYTSTLCAAQVPPDRIDQFIQVVNQYPGVTHNYLRRHQLNIWFTLIAESSQRIGEILKEIGKETGLAEIYSFPAKRIFKIQVDFAL